MLRRVLGFVDDFRRVVDFRFGLGRTGLTGRVYRSGRYGPGQSGHWIGYSGFGSGLSGLRGPDTPSICPGTPDFGLRVRPGQTGLTGWVYQSDRCGRG